MKVVLEKIEGFSKKEKLHYPDSPICMDAPSISYKTGLGEKKVLFSMRINCCDGYLNSSYSEAITFRTMLNGYSAQYSLLR